MSGGPTAVRNSRARCWWSTPRTFRAMTASGSLLRSASAASRSTARPTPKTARRKLRRNAIAFAKVLGASGDPKSTSHSDGFSFWARRLQTRSTGTSRIGWNRSRWARTRAENGSGAAPRPRNTTAASPAAIASSNARRERRIPASRAPIPPRPCAARRAGRPARRRNQRRYRQASSDWERITKTRLPRAASARSSSGAACGTFTGSNQRPSRPRAGSERGGGTTGARGSVTA